MNADLLAEMDARYKRLQGLSASGATRGDLPKRNAAETAYGKAYANLVRAGLRRQLRGKYRV